MEGFIALSASAEVPAVTPAPAFLRAPAGDVGFSSQWHVELGASLVIGGRSDHGSLFKVLRGLLPRVRRFMIMSLAFAA